MSWGKLAMEAPEIARLGKLLLERQGVAFLGTTRPNGSPRLHPVAPVLSHAELLLVIIDHSPKSRDLRRDPRCVLHALPGPGDAEFWVESVAEPQSATATREWLNCDKRLTIPSGDTLFRLTLTAAHATIFQPGENNRPVPSRRHWRAPGEEMLSTRPSGARHG